MRAFEADKIDVKIPFGTSSRGEFLFRNPNGSSPHLGSQRRPFKRGLLFIDGTTVFHEGRR